MSSVKNFGATGDGQTDDTEAILHTLRDGDGGLEFPRGNYRISRTIEIPLDTVDRTGISGLAGVATVINAGPGPAFRFVGTHGGTANPRSFEPETWARERMPTVMNIEIVGDHDEADGIELTGTALAVIEGLLVRECRHGIHLTGRNRNTIVSHCHLYHNRGVGLYLDRVNLHQINVVGSHISYNRIGGIRVVGSEIRNLQVTGNDLEYNNHRSHDGTEPEPTAELYIDTTAGGSSVAELTVASNTLQATPSPGGANIRILGSLDQNHPPGLATITGNVIGNQENAVHLTGCHAFSITGNFIYSSAKHTLLVEDSRQITVSANNFRRHTPRLGFGVRLIDTADSIIADCHLEDESEAGQESGLSPLELHNCRRINITGCQINNGVPYGIDLQDCSYTTIANCQILETRDNRATTAAVRWQGTGRANRVAQNTIAPGSNGTLMIDDAANVKVSDNLEDG